MHDDLPSPQPRALTAMPRIASLLARRECLLTVSLVVVWLLLLLLAVASPVLLASPTLGDDRVRCTIRLALLYYGLAAALMLALDSSAWQAASAIRLSRWLWSLALVAYLVHVGLAFHYYHHWSHADAYARTDRITNFGPGIYVSYLFTLLWTLDVAWWWLAPVRYTQRRPWLGWLLHSFLAFVIFNGSVTFAAGAVSWVSLGMFLVLAGLLLRRLLRRSAGTRGFLQRRPIAGIPPGT